MKRKIWKIIEILIRNSKKIIGFKYSYLLEILNKISVIFEKIYVNFRNLQDS